jgi:hypothetical protein
MTSRLIRIICIAAILIWPIISAAGDELFPPAEYIQSRLQQNDMVFLGTKHKQPEILRFVAELIPTPRKQGVSHIGLEIPSDQQDKIDAFMQTDDDLDKIQFHPQIDCPEYRNFLLAIRQSGGPPPLAIDLPYSMHAGDISRDEWMARTLLKALPGKILVVVGNLHTLKELEWEPQVPDKHRSIRQYIQRERPETRMWSVGQMIHGNPDECDFTKRFSSLPDAVALDLDNRYQGWKMGMTAPIAIVPTECFDLVDGLIVY